MNVSKRVRLASGLAAAAVEFGVVGLGIGSARAEPPPAALVITNSAYSALPKLSTCDLSSNLVAAVLSRAGFKVTRQTNVSNARLGTAIATLGEDAASMPDSRSLIYICGYAVVYSDRLFLLPSEVRLERDSDVLSQGIVARLLMSSVAGPGSAAGLVLMDVAPPPGKAALEFSSMLRPADSAHGGLIAAALPSTDAPGPAPLASAVSETVGDGRLEIGALLTSLAAEPGVRRSLLTMRPPADPSWLIGAPVTEPPPAPVVAVAPPAPVAAPPIAAPPVAAPPVAAPPPAAPPPAAPPVAAPAVTPPAAAPDDVDTLAEPNPADRRRLQLSLSRLGYYHGRVDGLFATDTMAAIRQFQRDSNADPTGKLTVKQAEQLLK